MSFLERPPGDPAVDQTEEHEPPRSVGSRLTEFRERVARAFIGLDRGRVDQPLLEPGSQEPGAETEMFDVLGEVPARTEDTGFPLGALGYNRAAVDARIAELEKEIEELRGYEEPAISITEEIERLGEQTASILVVAHDQAHETTRLAQEQADRCIADAATNAVAITEEAKQHLHALDNETEAVWRERTRLLEDARTTGLALVALAEEAQERFPEESKTPAPFPAMTDEVETPAPVPARDD
jgi:cell division septum initiation protein DivIVA